MAVHQRRAGRSGALFVAVHAVHRGAAAEQGEDTIVGVFLVVVADPAQAEVVVRLEQQLPAETLACAAVEGIAVVEVLHVAVVAGCGRPTGARRGSRRAVRKSCPWPGSSRPRRRIFNAALGVKLGARVPMLITRPWCSCRTGCPAGRARPPAARCREGRTRPAGAAEVDVVEVQPDAAFQAVAGRVVAEAADRHAGLARVDVGDVGARHQLLQVLHR